MKHVYRVWGKVWCVVVQGKEVGCCAEFGILMALGS